MTLCGLNNSYMYPSWGLYNDGVSTTPPSYEPLFTFDSPTQTGLYNINNFDAFSNIQSTNIIYPEPINNYNDYGIQQNYLSEIVLAYFMNLAAKQNNNVYNQPVVSNKHADFSPPRRSTISSVNVNYNSNNLPGFDASGYNADKAKLLAIAAENEHVGRFDGQCATHVKRAIQQAGLGEYVSGDAHQVDTILRDNKNFREISSENIDLTKLPAGCVLVYERGVSGYSDTAGHVEITLGDGTAVSGGKTRNIRPGAKIFVPV